MYDEPQTSVSDLSLSHTREEQLFGGFHFHLAESQVYQSHHCMKSQLKYTYQETLMLRGLSCSRRMCICPHLPPLRVVLFSTNCRSSSCCRMCLMSPPAAFAKCSGTVPFRLLRPPNIRLMAPTPKSCLRYTFLAIAAASKRRFHAGYSWLNCSINEQSQCKV